MPSQPPFSTTTLMVKPPPSLTPTDVHDSAPSEIDSVSDSDWLDISTSEDAGSIGIPESDRDEAGDRPLSRRSFSSHSSSRDDDVDIWEGLVESADDEVLEEPTEFSRGPSPLARSSFTHNYGHSAEERRVEDALNQSMVSTLSTSRASSMSASGTTNHPTSRARDLRLSFPDPLSSSKDELIRSPEGLLFPPPTIAGASPPPELSDDEEPTDMTPSAPSCLLKLPTVEFEIYLYGTPPEYKWSIVECLMGKLGAISNCAVSERHPQGNRISTYSLRPKGNLRRLSLGCAVSVIDNTEAQSVSNTEPVLDKPSLAIVFLPTFLPSLPLHTLFLPVIASTSHDLDASGFDERERQVFEQQWSIFKIPKKQHLFPGAATILTVDEVGRMGALEVAQAFEPLQPLRRKILRGIKNQVASTPAVTIVAILSIVLGYIVSRFVPLAAPMATLTEEVNPTSAIRPTVNLSEHLATPFVTQMSSAISVSSVRDISVAIVSTPPSSLSIIPTNRRSSLFGAEEPRPRNGKPINVAVASGSQSPIVSQQPPSSISEIPIRSKAVAVFQQAVEKTMTRPTETASLATKSRTEAMYSLSTRLASSLSEVFNVRALTGALRADMKELLDALDELLRVLSGQAASAIRVTEGLREQLRRRNQHAQQKARELRERGERMVSSLGERARGHVAQARSQARTLKDAVSAGVTTAYQRHRERGFVRKMRERQRGQSRKLRREIQHMTKGHVGL
ncbi:hypothetical protein BJV78DRAFT_1220934 [Lactifluus subvellereus]|nr:hypothetical protein BJV78DRAFT_1220934 [Lactifluus subvellereus]